MVHSGISSNFKYIRDFMEFSGISRDFKGFFMGIQGILRDLYGFQGISRYLEGF